MVDRNVTLTGLLYFLCFSAGLMALGLNSVRSDAPYESRPLHFTPNGNLGADGTYLPAKAGFNLADVSGREQLDLLPNDVRGLVWIGSCDGVTASFKQAVLRVISDPKLFGYYLIDDPDPRWWILRNRCSAENLKAEADWIHARRPDVVTFVSLMNLGESGSPSFGKSYTPETTHADFFAVAPYPCRTEWKTCHFDMIERFVHAAVDSGIPISKLVPIYQAFGLGNWHTDTGGAYRMPNSDELKEIIRRWSQLLPSPPFDFAYSWGRQQGDVSLASSPESQDIFLEHNTIRQDR
jgi:hypothetical protein